MRLSDVFIKPLAFTRLFLQEPDSDEPAFRSRLEQQLSEARLAAADTGHQRPDIEGALFAVIAWIDETVMCSEWAGAEDWRRRPMQKSTFNTTRAGMEFFIRLEALRKEDAQVREVYFLCLSLGFKGRYGGDGGRFSLDEIKTRELRTLLDGGVTLDGNALLFPEAYVEGRAAPPRKRWRPTRAGMLLFAAPLGLLTLLYFVFALVLHSQVEAFLRLMQ